MNTKQLYPKEWKLISFLALDYEEQLDLIGNISSDYYLKSLDTVGNYFLQSLILLLYYSDSDFFPHTKQTKYNTISGCNGSLECLCLFVFEDIFHHNLDISKINMNLFCHDSLSEGNTWIFIRKMAKNGLEELNLYPYNFKSPINIALPAEFNESLIHNRGKNYFL